MDELEKLLAAIDKKVKTKLEKLLRGLTDKQRLALIQNPKLIDQLLADINVEEIAKHYIFLFNEAAIGTVFSFKDIITKAQQNKVNVFVKSLTQLKTASLRDFVISRKQEFTNKIFEFVSGQTKWDIAKSYFDKTPFTGSQIGTLINTTESDIRRTTVLSAFEDRPDQRYEYIGGLIPTSSETCTWLIENQNPEGYTLDEIQAGIETPFGTVDWNGRIPSWNCIHSWSPILD